MTSWSVITPTGIGTGVARTSLGTNNKPSEAENLIEVVPYQAPTGAVTAGESILTEVDVESVSVKDILPKRMILAPIQAGLGATFAMLIPILEAFEFNTPLTSGSNDIIEAFGQAQIANTVAPTVGVGLHYSNEAPRKPQLYYEKPDNETSTGTASTTVTGNNIVINGGTKLMSLFAELSAGTVLASESYISSMQFNSPNFDNSQAIEVPLQPTGVGLAGLNSTMQAKSATYINLGMGMKPTTTITTVLRLSEALTNAGNFIGGVGYLK